MSFRKPPTHQYALREAIVECMESTNSPISCNQIAAYLCKNGWAHVLKNPVQSVSANLGIMRQRGIVKRKYFYTGKPTRVWRYGEYEERIAGWYLQSCTNYEIAAIAKRMKAGGRFKEPKPRPMPVTGDMRQMLEDIAASSNFMLYNSTVC